MRKPISISIAAIIVIVTAYFGVHFSAGSKNYNVVLISVDTLRADRLGCYGYKRATTKHIDSLAQQGILFEKCFAQSPLTLPSHSSIMSGTNPTIHGVRDNLYFTFPQEIPTIASILKTYNYQTAAVVSAAPLNREKKLDKGFDKYSDVADITVDGSQFISERIGEESVTKAIDYLNTMATTEPFFLWLHLFDPHAEYKAPQRFAESFDHPYDAEIAYTDECIGKFLDQLKKLKMYENTIIVFVSDHGEGLGEHGELSHGYFVYNTTTHVPLIIKAPQLKGNQKISEPVRTIDILPTVMSLLGIQDLRDDTALYQHASNEGKDLFPATQNDKPLHLTCYSETYYPYHVFGWSTVASIVEGKYKYIHTKQGELYDITQDFSEKNNLIPQEDMYQQLALEKKNKLIEIQKKQSTTHYNFSDPNEQQMAGIGYLQGSQPKIAPTQGPDPIEMLDVLKLIVNAQTQMFLGRLTACENTLRLILDRDPTNITAWTLTGKLYMQTGQHQKAIEAFDQLERLCSVHRFARNSKIDALIELRKLQEAQKLIEKTISEYQVQNDAFLLSRSAYIALQNADYQQAQLLAKQATLAPQKLPSSWFYLARALQMQKKYHQAIKEYAKAVQLKQKYSQAYYYWAECLFLMDKIPQSKIKLQQAMQQSPSPLLQKQIAKLFAKIQQK